MSQKAAESQERLNKMIGDLRANLKLNVYPTHTPIALINMKNYITQKPHENWRWPKPEDIDKLQLNEKLKLKEIRTAPHGETSYELGTIQLVFQDGITSPKFGRNVEMQSAPI